MKKLLVIFLTLILCLSVTACVDDDAPIKEQSTMQSTTVQESQNDSISNDESQTESLIEEEDLTFSLNETAVFNNLKITATEIKESNGTDFFTPENGNIFVGIKFTIENISDEEQTISTLMLFEGYADDIKCDYSFDASCAFDEGTLDGTVAAGKKLVGWYALEVPENWSEINLDVQPDMFSRNKATFIFTK